jgi:hypothetical protein
MTHDQELVALEGQSAVRSGVRIEMNAKGQCQPKVSVYEGTTREQMQASLDIAIETMAAAVRTIDATAGLSTP